MDRPPGAGMRRAGREIAQRPDRWVLVAVAGMLAFVAMLDMTIANVALAEISASFDVPAEAAQWAVLGYQLSVVALLLPVGRWLDGAGLRPALLAAVSGFALCSAAAAAAPSVGALIVTRVLQGGFGAVLFVLMPVLAARAVRPEFRGRAMSVPATLGPLGAVSGAALGGVLLDQLGWRAIFLVKIPLCLAALALSWRSAPAGRLPRPDRRAMADAGLVAVAVAAVLLALTLAPTAPVWLLLGVIAVIPFGLWLRGPGSRPVVAVIRDSGILGITTAVLALAAGFAAMHYLVALHLQRDGGVSASVTGLTVLAFPLAMGLAGPVGGRLADRFGARRLAVIGAAVTALGLLLLIPLGEVWSPPDVAWRLAVAGLGMGLNGGPTQALVMTSAPTDRMATAGSTVQLARSLGFALGPALATAAWGLAGGGDGGVRAGLGLAAVAGCVAVPLLLVRPSPLNPTNRR